MTCIDWYWITDYSDGTQTVEYIGRTCDCSGQQSTAIRDKIGNMAIKLACGDDGGSGGGDGPCPPQTTQSIRNGKVFLTIKPSCADGPPGIFGLNNSNAVVPLSKFNALKSYAQSIGLTVHAAYSGYAIDNRGNPYPGQFTVITDADDNIVSCYFTPTNSGGPFSTAMEYNLGTAGPTGNDNPNNNFYNYGDFNFGSPVTGPVTYTPSNPSVVPNFDIDAPYTPDAENYYKLDATTRAMYPRFTKLVDQLGSYLDANQFVVNAIAYYTGYTSAQVNS